MLFANDSNGVRTYAETALNGQKYFCPICDEELICKNGKIRKHHFAHRTSAKCKDSWYYDMTEWHNKWQSFFPPNNQEVVFACDGVRHRADVAIDNIVLEFQHSKISAEEFCNRNAFYHSLGKKIIWVFDADGKIDHDWDTCGYSKSIESSLLCSLNIKSQIFTDECIRKTADLIFLCENIDNNCDDGEMIGQVYQLSQASWFWSRHDRQSSMILFGIDEYYYNTEFVDIILGKISNDNIRYGTIPYLWRKNRIENEAIFENENGFKVRITSNPIKMYEKYGQLYGNFSAPKRTYFSNKTKRVAGMDLWQLISFK